MGLIKHDYLSTRMLKGLAAYKYKAGGYTWLDELHNPAWNWIVENCFPMWLAPNLVTLTGVMCIIMSHICLAVYAPDMDGKDAPKWVHLLAGLSLVVYVNLDCMDGKQARRTGTSSPLGQLFDHGCDALSVGLILVNVCTSACLLLSPTMVLMMGAPLTTWILAQWEEYHTGTYKRHRERPEWVPCTT
jgi:phosphatidylglycerophosphate synthase